MTEEYYETPNVDGIVKAVKIIGGVTLTAAAVYGVWTGYRYYRNKMIEHKHADTMEIVSDIVLPQEEKMEKVVETVAELKEEIEESTKFKTETVDYSAISKSFSDISKKTTIDLTVEELDDEEIEVEEQLEKLDPYDVFPYTVYDGQSEVPIGAHIFNTREELGVMQYEPNTMEARRQYVAYILMSANIYLNPEREENTIAELRAMREDFFGEDAPESIIATTSFAELLVYWAKRVQYDWGENSLASLIDQMLANINWWDARDRYGEDEYIERVVDNMLDADDITPMNTVGLFGLDEEYVDNFGNPRVFSFLEQYSASTFGE
jgi:hypothetical protein